MNKLIPAVCPEGSSSGNNAHISVTRHNQNLRVDGRTLHVVAGIFVISHTDIVKDNVNATVISLIL